MSIKIFSDLLPSFLDRAWFIFSFILCLLSWIDGGENDDDFVPRGAVGVAEDMLEVSLIINVHFSLLCCDLVQLWFVLTLFGCHHIDGFLVSVGCCPKKFLSCIIMWFIALMTDCTLYLVYAAYVGLVFCDLPLASPFAYFCLCNTWSSMSICTCSKCCC